MTIVGMTGFDEGAGQWNGPHAPTVSTNGRGGTNALSVPGHWDGNYNDPCWVYTPLPAADNVVAMSAAVYVPTSSIATSTWNSTWWPFFVFWDSTVDSCWFFGSIGGSFGGVGCSAPLWSPSTYNGSYVFNLGPTVPLGQWFYLEVIATQNTSVYMRVNEGQLYSMTNGSQVRTYGQYNWGVNRPWQHVGLGGMNFTGGAMIRYDDVVIQTGSTLTTGDWLGDVTIETVPPTVNGSSSQLTGSDGNSVNNYQLVDDTTIDVTDYVTGSGRDSYGGFTPQHNAGTLVAVGTKTLLQATDALSTKTAIADYTTHGTRYSGTSVTPGTSLWPATRIDTRNPNTGQAWTFAEIAAMEAGVTIF